MGQQQQRTLSPGIEGHYANPPAVERWREDQELAFDDQAELSRILVDVKDLLALAPPM